VGDENVEEEGDDHDDNTGDEGATTRTVGRDDGGDDCGGWYPLVAVAVVVDEDFL